ncbi:hypothetical protein [uncultured Desulfobacter sp.]|nr:hypothetical protein [uncultured Desulfobacter sp.]
MTQKQQQNKQCLEIVKEKEKERQQTMDKMSLNRSEAHTYDKTRGKCS